VPGDSLTGEVWDTDRGTRTGRPDVLADTLEDVLVSGFTGTTAALPFGLRTGMPLSRENGPEVLAISPDGAHLAIGGAFGSVTIWDAGPVRRLVAVVPAPSAVPGCADCSRVTALAFSPDSLTLAVGHGSGSLRLWDVGTRQPLGGSLSTPGDAIRSLAFSADGGHVHASSGHVPVQGYAIAPARVADQLCARAGRTLTPAEWQTYFPDVPHQHLCEHSPTDAVNVIRSSG
jgi:WD40 repeat protein